MSAQKDKVSKGEKVKSISRREFIKTVTAGMFATGLGANIIIPGKANADRKKLKILKWSHIVPSFDEWFKETYVKEWGEKNDTEVIVDYFYAPVELLQKSSAAVSAQKGHDLVMFLWPPAAFENHVIDHNEIYQECEKKYGKANELAVKSTYNPKTKKYYGFSESYVPDPVIYRKDLWDGVGIYPHTWEDVLRGGMKIKKKTVIQWLSAFRQSWTLIWPCGLSCILLEPRFRTRGATWSSTQSRPWKLLISSALFSRKQCVRKC